MVRGVTEQTEFVLSRGGVHLGVLGGARARSSKFMRPLTERQRNAKDAMRVLIGRPACDHSSAAYAAFAGVASAAQVNVEEESANVMDNGIVTPVAELSPTHWDCTDAVTFTSVAPDLDVASETDEENTLICHQCGADHIAPFDVAFPF
jgi:hypothetical protein